MKFIATFGLFFFIFCFGTTKTAAQNNPSLEDLQRFFNNKQVQITWREGEVLYGTYYFVEVHYCSNGYYGLYGNTVKKSVLGGENRTNWKEFGTWKITTEDNVNGMLYSATNGNSQFYPLYWNGDGNLYTNNATIIQQGAAICN